MFFNYAVKQREGLALLNYKFILKCALLVTAGLFVTLATSMAFHSKTPLPTPVGVPATSVEDESGRIRYVEYLGQRKKQLLSNSCSEGSDDRIRYMRDECFADHVIEITFHKRDRTGTVQLESGGDGYFTNSEGNQPVSSFKLSSADAEKLRVMLVRSLSKLPGAVQSWQMPPYLSAIEACISRQPFLVTRQSSSDAQFENVASDIPKGAGLKIASKSGGGCM